MIGLFINVNLTQLCLDDVFVQCVLLFIVCNISFTDATRIGRDLFYLVTWHDGSKFFAAKEALKNWPHLVFNFLEQNLFIE